MELQERKQELNLSKLAKFLIDSPSGLGEWYINLPFEVIPEVFIERITENYYPTTSVEEWRKLIPWLNMMPTIWNSCLIQNKEKVLAFAYGDWDPLLSHMQIIRFSIEPKLFRVDGKFMSEALDACRVHARLLGVRRIYWITCRWKTFLRKVPDQIKLADVGVLEVLNV